MPKVTGISSAMPADGPMPGSTPMIVPRKHAEERVPEVDRLQADREAVEDVVEGFHVRRAGCRLASCAPKSRVKAR